MEGGLTIINNFWRLEQFVVRGTGLAWVAYGYTAYCKRIYTTGLGYPTQLNYLCSDTGWKQVRMCTWHLFF